MILQKVEKIKRKCLDQGFCFEMPCWFYFKFSSFMSYRLWDWIHKTQSNVTASLMATPVLSHYQQSLHRLASVFLIVPSVRQFRSLLHYDNKESYIRAKHSMKILSITSTRFVIFYVREGNDVGEPQRGLQHPQGSRQDLTAYVSSHWREQWKHPDRKHSCFKLVDWVPQCPVQLGTPSWL